MKKFALILCILGFTSLIVGSVLAFPSIQRTLSNVLIIKTSGTIIGNPPDESQSQQQSYQTNLDQIGYLIILASIGFFTVAFLHNRKST